MCGIQSPRQGLAFLSFVPFIILLNLCSPPTDARREGVALRGGEHGGGVRDGVGLPVGLRRAPGLQGLHGGEIALFQHKRADGFDVRRGVVAQAEFGNVHFENQDD
jgi:hypothetical protein